MKDSPRVQELTDFQGFISRSDGNLFKDVDQGNNPTGEIQLMLSLRSKQTCVKVEALGSIFLKT